MEPQTRRLLMEQDAVLLAERLLAWTDEQIAEDLAAYNDMAPEDAREARDMFLKWLKSSASRKPTG